jgi:hypothetical protein
MSYLTLVALMLLVVSPVLIPLAITGVHAIRSLREKRKPFRLRSMRSAARLACWPTEDLEIRCTAALVTRGLATVIPTGRLGTAGESSRTNGDTSG